LDLRCGSSFYKKKYQIQTGIYIMQVDHIISPPLPKKSILHPQGGKFFWGGFFSLIFSLLAHIFPLPPNYDIVIDKWKFEILVTGLPGCWRQ